MTLSEQLIPIRRCTFRFYVTLILQIPCSPRNVWKLTCAGQCAAQAPIVATLQRRCIVDALMLITSLALEAARGVRNRGQLERIGGLARVAVTALNASGEYLVRRAFDLCKLQQKFTGSMSLSEHDV